MSPEFKSVAFVGNIANNFYRAARILRVNGVIAHLYAQNQSSNTSEPESDPTWVSSDNEFIFQMPVFRLRDAVAMFLNNRLLLSKRLRVALDQLSKYDLVFVSGPETVLCHLIPNTVAWQPTGSDLTVMPSLSWLDKVQLGRVKRSLKGLLQHIWEKKTYRTAILSSQFICTSALLPPYRAALHTIGVDWSRIRNPIPLVLDAHAFTVTDEHRLLGRQKWPELSNPFIIFWLGRMMFSKPSAGGVEERTGQWKKSEVGLYGFTTFLNRLAPEERCKVRLAIPDRTQSDDLERAKSLVVDLGITQNVVFIAGESIQGLTRKEMLNVFANSAAVFDDFGAGWYGSAALEAVAAGIPVITYAPDRHYPNRMPLPFLGARESIEVADYLYLLWCNRSDIHLISETGKSWLGKHHGSTAALKQLTGLLAEVEAGPP